MADQQPQQSTSTKPDKPPYPYGIFFILSNELCERFNFYGMRTILTLYFVQKLHFTDDDATVIYHTAYALVFVMALLGGIIADNFIGKYHTIWSGSCFYVLGTLLLACSAIPGVSGAVGLSFTALGLIAVGSGGIKPCVSSFGGEQFKLPEQMSDLDSFFQLFYFVINFGSFVATITIPLIRDGVHCYDENDCYSLAFFVPSIMMISSLVIFLAGTPLYFIKKTKGHSLIDTFKTIFDAIKGKIKNDKTQEPKLNWLLYAHPKHDYQSLRNAKILLQLLVLYLPLPFFWTLYDQQASRWTLQSTRLDGDIGPYRIRPGQMNVLNPLLILTLIPLFKVFFYPLLAKIGINTPLRKLVVGGCFAGFAFIASFFLELSLMKTLPTLPGPTQAHLRVYNGMPCDFDVKETTLPGFDKKIFGVLEMDEKLDFDGLTGSVSYNYTLIPSEFDPEDEEKPRCNSILKGTFEITPGEVTGYFFKSEGITTRLVKFNDTPKKDTMGRAIVRVLSSFEREHTVQLKEGPTDVLKDVTDLVKGTPVTIGTYQLTVDDSDVIKCNDTNSFMLKGGGVYVILLDEIEKNDYECVIFVITEPNSISLLWQIPQYTIITMGEVMFSVTGLEFSFTEAPATMKSTITAIWLITIAIGNFIVVGFAKLSLFEEQLWEYLMFAVLIWIDMGIFAFLAWRYKSVPDEDNPDAWIKELEAENEAKLKTKNK